MSQAGGRGFTLMEMLVVLAITSIVSALLFQALSQVYGLQDRLGAQLQRSQGGAMQLDWYRQMVQQLQPDLPDAPGRFNGESRGFSALGLNPLGSQAGLPQLMKLKLDVQYAKTRLLLSAGDGPEVALAEWEGLGDAAFVYLDDQGQSHQRWPESLDLSLSSGAGSSQSSGKVPALPAVILLRLRDEVGRDQWFSAVPRSRFEPLQRKPNLIGLP